MKNTAAMIVVELPEHRCQVGTGAPKHGDARRTGPDRIGRPAPLEVLDYLTQLLGVLCRGIAGVIGLRR